MQFNSVLQDALLLTGVAIGWTSLSQDVTLSTDGLPEVVCEGGQVVGREREQER